MAVRPGGGGLYAAAGIHLWEDDVAYASYTGANFWDYYTEYQNISGISLEGAVPRYKETRLIDLVYNAKGTYDCIEHAKEYTAVPNPDMVDAALMRPLVGSNTRGIHVMGRPFPDTLAELRALADECGAMLGIENESFHLYPESGRLEMLREMAKHVHMFSLSFVELQDLLPEIRDIQDGVELLQSFDTPCFFRAGTHGAYYISGHKPYYSPMVDHFGSVDPTGCGNTSTAAAFWALTKGMEPMEISYIGAVTASYNASFVGLITDFSEEKRAECKKVFEEQIAAAQS